MTRTEKTLGVLLFTGMFLPVVSLGFCNKHYCDEYCLGILYNGYIGPCIESTIWTTCIGISIFWFALLMISATTFVNFKDTIFHYVIMAAIIAFSIFLAIIDPSKWIFAVGLILSTAIFATAIYIYKKKCKTPKE